MYDRINRLFDLTPNRLSEIHAFRGLLRVDIQSRRGRLVIGINRIDKIIRFLGGHGPRILSACKKLDGTVGKEVDEDQDKSTL